MALNPAKQEERLNSPVERASNINDPQFENQQGYFPYDLTHQEFITPLFGQVTPTMHLDTVPGDRVVVKDNTKLILNQINGNLLSTVNQYVDSFYVPLRNVFPTNYEKLIPNPVKGDDLPNSALPVVPFFAYLRDLYRNDYVNVYYNLTQSMATMNEITEDLLNLSFATRIDEEKGYYLGRLILLATVLSRGQLLDYLGLQIDNTRLDPIKSSGLQSAIDGFFRTLYYYHSVTYGDTIEALSLDLTKDQIDISNLTSYDASSLSTFRSAISDALEAGKLPYIIINAEESNEAVIEAMADLVSLLDTIFSGYMVERDIEHLNEVDSLDSLNTESNINIGKILAYQQVIAHYYTNDKVDNVYSSDLFMQNLRSIMFPTQGYSSSEPIFDMNGIKFEYDYISYGGFWSSLLTDELRPGVLARQFVWATVMLLLRRSLRYGDYFASSRPNLLAVTDQLAIAVDGQSVSPIDVTKNLLMQRYLNAANYIGQGFLQYMSSIYGIKPSDTGCTPRFISHRKIELENRVTTNTANAQGAQTTNIVGFSDSSAFDVFIDDFGYLISLTSFDVLPVYKSGIDSSFHFTDRFDYFNPMLQGIGDQPIRSSEILGWPGLYSDTFGYTMRNSEYKFKLSKAHGAFCNSLPGFMLSYPLYAYNEDVDEYDLTINPDFIRDKPIYLDPVIPQQTGVSPAEYYHFIVSCTNQVQCARKIQATPGILF